MDAGGFKFPLSASRVKLFLLLKLHFRVNSPKGAYVTALIQLLMRRSLFQRKILILLFIIILFSENVNSIVVLNSFPKCYISNNLTF